MTKLSLTMHPVEHHLLATKSYDFIHIASIPSAVMLIPQFRLPKDLYCEAGCIRHAVVLDAITCTRLALRSEAIEESVACAVTRNWDRFAVCNTECETIC